MFIVSLGLLVLAYNTYQDCVVFAAICVIGAVIICAANAL